MQTNASPVMQIIESVIFAPLARSRREIRMCRRPRHEGFPGGMILDIFCRLQSKNQINAGYQRKAVVTRCSTGVVHDRPERSMTPSASGGAASAPLGPPFEPPPGVSIPVRRLWGATIGAGRDNVDCAGGCRGWAICLYVPQTENLNHHRSNDRHGDRGGAGIRAAAGLPENRG